MTIQDREREGMRQIEKNTVNPREQMKENGHVFFEMPDNQGIRVMFLGNSITLHAPAPEIGWNRFCGMAASARERDYVHLMMAEIKKLHPDAAFCICQGAEWECQYKSGERVYDIYEGAREFGADVIIVRLIENCPENEVDLEIFQKQLGEYLCFLSGDKESKILLSTSFWHHALDEGIRRFAEKCGYPLVELGDLGEDRTMKAIGLFAHAGVENHPGDLGMKVIAERLFKGLQDNRYV